MLCAILFSGTVLMILLLTNAIKFRYYPSIKGDLFTVQSIIFYILYTFLMLIPLSVNVGEGIKWKHMQSKI